MKVNQKSVSKKKIFLNDYLILIFLFCIVISINSGYYHIQNFTFNLHYPAKSFVNLVNSIRYILPFFIFFYAIIKIVYDRKRLDSFAMAFVIFSVFQIIILQIYPRDQNITQINSPQLIDSVHLLISCITIFLLIFITKDKTKILKIFILSILMLFCILWFYFFLKLFYEITFVNIQDSYLYFTETLMPGGKFLEQTNPRITGLSRIAGLIFVFSFLVINFLKKFNLFYFLISTLCFLTSLSIYASQTRGGLLIASLMLIVYIFLLKNNNVKKIIYITIYFLLPILVYESLYRPYVIELDKEKEKIEQEQGTYDEKYKSRLKKLKVENIQTYTSGRTEIWKKSLEIVFKQKYFLGFGPQADRYLLAKYAKNHLEAQWGNNSSNGLIYSIMSAGVVGLIFFIFIFYKILFLIYVNYFRSNVFKKNDYFKIVCFIFMLIMLLRTGFENGFFVFGIDFIILISSYYFLIFHNGKKI